MTTEERMAILETEVRHLTRQVEATAAIVTELRDLLVAARGTRWMLATLLSITTFVAGLGATFLPFFKSKTG
jgi:hypothetical protein